MDNLVSMWNGWLNSLPNFIAAAIVLLLAFLVSWILKIAVAKFLKLQKIRKIFEKANLKEDEINKAIGFVAKLVSLITFILFLPGIFGKLGLNGISDPIVSMMNVVLTYLPNIIAAILVLVIGLFISKLVKELFIPIFKKLAIDEWLEKLGFAKTENSMSKAEIFANVIYAIILIPVVIASLNILNIEAISKPAINMLNQIFEFIPNVVISIVIFFVGKFIAGIACTVLEGILVSIGTDKFMDNILEKANNENKNKFSLAKTIANIVKYVLIIFFVVQALSILQLDVLTKIGDKIINYMPYALSAVIITGIALIAGNITEKLIIKNFPKSKATALIAKVAIIVVGIFISLYQLGIAVTMVNTAFITILGALAVAFAISFGIGGREFASHMLKKLEDRIDKDKKE